MADVQFDDDNSFERRKFALQQGGRSGAVPHISTETKLMMSVFIAIMIGATLYIWLKFINISHPVVNDSNITPPSASAVSL